MKPNQQYIYFKVILGQDQVWGKMRATSFVVEIWRIAPSGGKSKFSHDQHAKMMDLISSLTSSVHGCLENTYCPGKWGGTDATLMWYLWDAFAPFFSVRDIRSRPWVGTLSNFRAICSVNIDGRRKAKSDSEIMNFHSLHRFSMSVPRHASVW